MLSVSGLTAQIGKVPVLRGVDLTVNDGDTVALLGRNGVGKTSTLRAILGLLRRTGGSVMYGGRSLTDIPAHKLAGLGIGYVPQGRGIFPLLTVEENLLPRRQRATRSGHARRDFRALSAPSRSACASRPARSPAASSRCWRSPAVS